MKRGLITTVQQIGVVNMDIAYRNTLLQIDICVYTRLCSRKLVHSLFIGDKYIY